MRGFIRQKISRWGTVLGAWLILMGGLACAADFNACILKACSDMPRGGGYAADRAAEVRLARSGVIPDRNGCSLQGCPSAASPTFCSAACYLVLLRALQYWERQEERKVFSAEVWQALRVDERHPDGYLSWGRFNANGPGCAKWVHDLGAGISFTSPALAKPGDFLKIFFSSAAGATERGHFVVFLGIQQINSTPFIVYWSANRRTSGYGVVRIALNDKRIRFLLFTRITRPENIARAPQLPLTDPWLASMLSRTYSFREMIQGCGLR